MRLKWHCNAMTTGIQIFLIGVGATAFIDLWALLRRWLFGTKLPDYGMVGRWLALMTEGRFVHESIARARPIRGERAIGWAFHYLTGITFASLMPLCFGVRWLAQPAFAPALAVGIATVAAPFFVMQPAMGAGFAASRTPKPGAARLQSLINHALFGVGLFLGAALIRLLTTGE